MDNQEEQLLKRIEKLMALGTSSNEHEAKRATEKAQELLVKHNLTMQQLDGLKNEYQQTPVDTVLRYKKEHSYVLDIIQEYFFVKVTFGKNYSGRSYSYRATYETEIKLVGTEANVAVAKYVYSYLVHTFKNLWKDHQRETGKDIRYRTPFMLGLRKGLMAKLYETRKKVENDMALVVIVDPNLEKHLVEVIKIRGAKKETVNKRDSETEKAGEEQGRKIQIARAVSYETENKGLQLAYSR